MVLEGGMLKDHVCARIIEQLRKNYPEIWASLHLDAAKESGVFTLEHLNTKLSFRYCNNASCKYTCSLLELQQPSPPLPENVNAARRATTITASITSPRNSEAKTLHARLPIGLEQLICALSKAYEFSGTPSEHVACLPLLTQAFLPDDYSPQSHHVVCLPEVVLLFLIDDEDMKVDEHFQFEHLMSIPQGRRLYDQLRKVLELYRGKGAVVEFNGHQLHTHSGPHITASDIVACLKSCHLMTKLMAMPFDCIWAPSDYPLFVKRSDLSFDDCVVASTNSEAVSHIYQRYMRGKLQWFSKAQIHGLSEEAVERLEAAHMEDVNGEKLMSKTTFEVSEPFDLQVDESRGKDEKGSETRSEASWVHSIQGKGLDRVEDDSCSDTTEENEPSDEASVPPQIFTMSSLVDLHNRQNELEVTSLNELMCHISHVTRGCYDQGLWFPHHLTFRSPFPFQEAGFILWRAYVYFGQCVAVCPVNTSDSIGDWESDEVKVDRLRRAVCSKVTELQRVWDGQAAMSHDELPIVWRYCVDLWIKDDEVWTERIRPISKCSSLLFSWEELRQWGLFKQISCLPVIRVPENSSSEGNDDFIRLFAGQRPIPQRI